MIYQKYIIKYTFYCCFVMALASTSFSYGQSSMSTTDLVANNLKLIMTKLPYVDNINYYNENKSQLPIIDEIGIRTETKEFDFDQQSYQLRFKFNNDTERRSQNRITNSNRAIYKTKQDQYLLEQLKFVNTDIVNLYFIKEEIRLIDDRLLLLNDIKTIFQNKMNNGLGFDMSGWLDNEEELMNENSDRISLSLEKNELEVRLGIQEEYDDEKMFKNWVTLDKIKSIIFGIYSKSHNHPNYVMAKLIESKAMVEYDLEESKSKKWFEFIQLEYRGKDKLEVQEEFSLGASFKIPLSSNNRIKKNKAALEIIKNKYKTELQIDSRSKIINQTKSKLNTLFINLDLLDKFMEEQQLQKTYDNYTSQSNVLSPIELVTLKKIMLKQKVKKHKISKNIYLNYISLLYESGTLIDFPLKNYLDSQMSML